MSEEEQAAESRRKLRELFVRGREDPALRQRIIGSIENRVLTEQPELTPKERSEKLLAGSAK